MLFYILGGSPASAEIAALHCYIQPHVDHFWSLHEARNDALRPLEEPEKKFLRYLARRLVMDWWARHNGHPIEELR